MGSEVLGGGFGVGLAVRAEFLTTEVTEGFHGGYTEDCCAIFSTTIHSTQRVASQLHGGWTLRGFKFFSVAL
jgi:hypothetical protein